MTFDECQRSLEQIRQKQGTARPLVRVDYAGSIYKGCVAHADSDPGALHEPGSPFGVIVLEDPGLTRSPQTILQIATIPPGSIHDPEEN